MSQQTPLVSAITKWLGLRRNKMWLRYKDDMSPRTIPKPNIPPGVNAKLSDNYYYTRDARRKVTPPFVVMSAFQSTSQLESGAAKQLEGKSESTAEVVESPKPVSSVKLPTPGFPTEWTLSSDEPRLRE
uniref:NADH dehydrogenase [ubiquinone] 1 alpha subcomplex subunit 7 n=1 Tax=Phallusia mammillata TaxID=59560 RepID=A0A6F9DMI8_9ASCI|nr:NADH dehydrogenase [ubiquinone] 1 alpha subcomplex subunit 7-like [Phallusia mammillata]